MQRTKSIFIIATIELHAIAPLNYTLAHATTKQKNIDKTDNNSIPILDNLHEHWKSEREKYKSAASIVQWKLWFCQTINTKISYQLTMMMKKQTKLWKWNGNRREEKRRAETQQFQIYARRTTKKPMLNDTHTFTPKHNRFSRDHKRMLHVKDPKRISLAFYGHI